MCKSKFHFIVSTRFFLVPYSTGLLLLHLKGIMKLVMIIKKLKSEPNIMELIYFIPEKVHKLSFPM